MRPVLVLLLCFAFTVPALAQEVSIATSDTTQTVIAAQKGKRVTLRLQSGQEMTGTVREVTNTLVVVGAIAGREFFDAVVPLAAVEAVIIRTRQ
jgi:biopolymer transport protein ExbD